MWYFYDCGIVAKNEFISVFALIHAGRGWVQKHKKIRSLVTDNMYGTRLVRGAAGRRLDCQCDLDSDFQSIQTSQLVNFRNLSPNFDRSALREASHSLEVMSHTFLRCHWMTWAQPKISGPSESRKCAPKCHFWCDYGSIYLSLINISLLRCQ